MPHNYAAKYITLLGSESKPAHLQVSTQGITRHRLHDILYTGSSALELLLGPEGEYVREIIIDELAKGIDAGWRSSLDSFKGSARHRLLSLFGVTNSSVSFPSVCMLDLSENISCLPCMSIAAPAALML